MNELKSEDVKKALKRHASPTCADCGDCPLVSVDFCVKQLSKNALALIREKDAEIERLKNSITFQVVMPNEKMEEIKAKLLERIPSIRAEAITEFHRKYHEYLNFMNNINKPSPSWNNDDIQRVIVACGAIADQVKNEMKGANDGKSDL